MTQNWTDSFLQWWTDFFGDIGNNMEWFSNKIKAQNFAYHKGLEAFYSDIRQLDTQGSSFTLLSSLDKRRKPRRWVHEPDKRECKLPKRIRRRSRRCCEFRWRKLRPKWRNCQWMKNAKEIPWESKKRGKAWEAPSKQRDPRQTPPRFHSQNRLILPNEAKSFQGPEKKKKIAEWNYTK